MECYQREEHGHVSRKGGLRTIPFIIATEGCERIVSAGISANVIIYLTKDYNMGAASSVVVLFVYQAAASFLPVLGAVVSDALLGRFLTITLTLFACTIGSALLWLTTMIPKPVVENTGNGKQSFHSPTNLQLFVLFSSLAFLSVGASGVRPCCLAFGADQLAHCTGDQKDRAHKVLFFWYYVSMGGSHFIAMTLLVYLQYKLGWKIGFAIPVGLMALVTFLNILASPFYIKVKPQKSTWASLFQVLFVAMKNRHVQIPETSDGVQYHNVEGMELVPSSRMRFLNRACLLRTHADGLNTEMFNANRSNMCTVEQVEDLKSTLSVIPIWSAMINVSLIQYGQSFRVLQADTMNRSLGVTKFKIPAGSIAIFEVATFTLLSGCYDRYMLPVLQKITGKARALSHKQKVGIGVAFSILSATTASVVEAVRRKEAIKQGWQDKADGIVNMSALWLAPQGIFSGLTSVFGSIGQIELYYAVLPKKMGSLTLALLLLATGVANIEATVIVKLVKVVTARGGRVSWLPDNLNQGHYDYYYCLLAVIGTVNFFYFLVCWHWFEEPKPIDEPSMDYKPEMKDCSAIMQ